jgi:hypothetical protein
MKISFALRLTVGLLVFASGAMATEPLPAPAGQKSTQVSTPPAPAKLTRFDLDFPGGTPAELATAISQAMGKHLNLVIPPNLAETKIGPLKLEGVTIPDVFRAVGITSAHQVMVPSGPSGSYSFKDILIEFENPDTASPVSDSTVWSMNGTMPPTISSPQVCRYFQLGPYLENYSIEDITTAIQTGWKMAKIDPLPQLSFHKETQLLIAVGPEANVDQIPDVLSALRLNRGPAVDRIMKLQAELDEALASPGGGNDKKAAALQKEISEIAARQKANETIDNSRMSVLPPRVISH